MSSTLGFSIEFKHMIILTNDMFEFNETHDFSRIFKFNVFKFN